MADWEVYWQAIGTVAAILFGTVGLYKIYIELQRLNEQRDKETIELEMSAKLKRTEFFLSQHRRLFDDKDLYDVLCHVDADSPRLADLDMWDKKRKLLVFFEEIALLVQSDQIDKNVALYMFGYYTVCIRNGSNFNHGINLSKVHWALFFTFAEEAEVYLSTHSSGPPKEISL